MVGLYFLLSFSFCHCIFSCLTLCQFCVTCLSVCPSSIFFLLSVILVLTMQNPCCFMIIPFLFLLFAIKYHQYVCFCFIHWLVCLMFYIFSILPSPSLFLPPLIFYLYFFTLYPSSLSLLLIPLLLIPSSLSLLLSIRMNDSCLPRPVPWLPSVRQTDERLEAIWEKQSVSDWMSKVSPLTTTEKWLNLKVWQI